MVSWYPLKGWVMNQDQWKQLVMQEAASSKWQLVAGFLAWVSLLLLAVSLATGWGNPWVLVLMVATGAGMWAVERAMHRETMRTLKEMAGMAASRGGVEA